MNPVVEKAQSTYRNERKKANYNIFDIECMMRKLAGSGQIWMIKGMKDLTESETILIYHYLNENRELQVYDLVESP